jgi:hypothetical protein
LRVVHRTKFCAGTEGILVYRQREGKKLDDIGKDLNKAADYFKAAIKAPALCWAKPKLH